VSDYGLDDRVIEVRSPTGAEDLSSSPCIQTGSEAHQASYPMGTRGSFPRGKVRPGRNADHSPPSSAEVKYEQELYLLSPHAPQWHVAGHLYLYYFISLIRVHTTTLSVIGQLVVCSPTVWTTQVQTLFLITIFKMALQAIKFHSLLKSLHLLISFLHSHLKMRGVQLVSQHESLRVHQYFTTVKLYTLSE
jgi:hypothetical protein